MNIITKSYFFTFLSLFSISLLFSQDTYQRNSSADVKSYVFGLTLSDESNLIKGETEINIDFTQEVGPFSLDLIEKNGDYGMTISQVLEGDTPAKYTYNNHKIEITPSASEEKNRTYKVIYEGIPERGLVIDTTKFGQRSFFGDNWPNLARHWLPSVDHPYDKAGIEFRITAPDYYDVVATGEKVEEKVEE